jgi:hypothetical protein
MENIWVDSYRHLVKYVEDNDEIGITQNILRIPEHLRDGFYELFDSTRNLLIEQILGEKLDELNIMSREYGAVKKEAADNLKLSEIKLKLSLEQFIENPYKYLSLQLRDPLFALLGGKISPAALEQEAESSIYSLADVMLKESYKKWVETALFSKIESEQVYTVKMPDARYQSDFSDCYSDPGTFYDNVSEIKKATSLNLDRDGEKSLITPDVIIHNKSESQYVSMRGDINHAIALVRYTTDQREWLPIDKNMATASSCWPWCFPDMVIYKDRRLENITLVADYANFCRPDIVIQSPVKIDTDDTELIEKIVYIYNRFKPAAGMYIVTREYLPAEVKELIMAKAITEHTTGQDSSLMNMKDADSGKQEATQPQDLFFIHAGYASQPISEIITTMGL